MKRNLVFLLLLFFAGAVKAQLVDALPDEAWNDAAWISVADAPEVKGRVNDETRAADGANWFMTTLVNEKKVVKALWMTVSLGVNELYVNGQRIGNEVLRPGFSHHSRTKYSFTYDVTKAFVKKKGGQNTLAAQVTPGWWADKIITPSGSNGMYGQKCALRGVLELTFDDGTTRRYGTNTTDWRAGIAGPVVHAAIFDGEEYDARVPLGFLTPEKLHTPTVSKEYVGVITPSVGAEVYQLWEMALHPQRAYVYSKVEGATADEYGKIVVDREYAQGRMMMVHRGEHLVVDFGQNCAAVPSFRFKAKEGTRLSCLPAELLNDGNGAKARGMDDAEGSVHRTNLRTHQNSIRLDYTFANSKKAVEYTPRCTFFGYRYLSITATDDVVIEQIRSIPVSSIAPIMETGRLTTGNEMVNKLISNTMWGMRSNYLSIPTDCPQRNERLGWTADTQVFCETGTFFANTCRFFHKWLRDLRDSQSPAGGYPGVAPAAQYGTGPHDYMRLGWADAGIIVPWTIWKQFGDNTIIEESWESMKRYMDHVNQTKYDHVALSNENGNYQWADWLSYEPLESCGGGAFNNGPLPEAIEYWNYLGASYWAIDADMMRDMARATGRDTVEFCAMADNARAYLRQRFLNDDGTFKTTILNSMQTPALFALRNHLLGGEAKTKMKERLRENFREHGDCLQTGFLGTSILMPTLTDNGMSDVAYTLLFQRKNPSWLYSIDNGATTIWERWNSYMKDKGMGPKGMNSFNHYAYGVVCQWIWQTCAGIAADPLDPGFRHVIMKPVPDVRLGFVNAEYHSAAGLIKSSWRYEGTEWVWSFTIPAGATASVTLPGEQHAKEYQAGSYTIRKDNV
ncbi:MAG: family 78 glycoside hydrolase catalytic domain [Prevotella sp.]|nr:family 78 glycoside hydrolase catalytic domain [Prevotella sp.]